MIRSLLLGSVVGMLAATVAFCGLPAMQICGSQKVIPSGGPWNAPTAFGEAVAIRGDVAVVGARLLTSAGIRSGAATILEYDAGSWNESAVLNPEDLVSDSRFGASVALLDDLCFIGAPRVVTSGGLASGAVYIYARDPTGWRLDRKLEAPDAFSSGGVYAGFSFGISVAVHGDLLAVGATQDVGPGGLDTGAVYVFRRVQDEWVLEEKLWPPGGWNFERFGAAVAASGQVLVVGADQHDSPFTNSGCGYIFRRDGQSWRFEAKLQSVDPQPQEFSGNEVAISPDGVQAFLGCPSYDSGGYPYVDTGRVEVFQRIGSAWLLKQTIIPYMPEALGENFGISIALDGRGVLYIGAPAESHESVESAGTCTAYTEGVLGWTPIRQFSPPDAMEAFLFGIAVAADSGRMLVGARGDSTAGSDRAGAAYFVDANSGDCNQNGWPDDCDIGVSPSLDANSDGAIDSCSVRTGDAFCIGSGVDAVCPCGNFSSPESSSGCAHSGGVGARLSATGNPAMGADSLVFHARDLPPSVALLFQGTGAMSAVPFGDGQRCVGGELTRFMVQPSPQGLVMWPVGGLQRVSVQGNVTRAGSRHYQVWYRNSVEHCTPATFNLSNALRIDWGL